MSYDAKLAALGREYVEIMEKIKDLEERRLQIKDEVGFALREEGVAYKVVPVSDTEGYKFKNNYRSTKSLDKDGLAKDIGCDRDDLDYVGISKQIENERATSKDIEKFQTTNASTFITVKTYRIVPKSKKGK